MGSSMVDVKTIGQTLWRFNAMPNQRADVKTASKCNWRNPTYINALKLKKAQNELPNIYLKEQTEYIQNQINNI